MAVHARDSCVGTVQIGGVFRLHHGMAQPSAKSVRVREEIRVVTHEGKKNSNQTTSCQGEGESLPLMRIVQIDPGVGQCLLCPETPSPPTLRKNPIQEDQDSKNQEDRENHEGEDAEVGAGRPDGKTQQEEKEDQHDADQDDQAAKIADRVSVKALPF